MTSSPLGDLNNSPLADMFREKVYMLSVDILAKGYSRDVLITYLNDARAVSSWSSPMAGVFLFKSYERAQPLAERIRLIVRDARCLLVEINPGNMGGWLPSQAWEWFASPAPPAPTNALLGLFPPATKKD